MYFSSCFFVLVFEQVPEGSTGDIGRERTKTFTYDFSYFSADSKSPSFVCQEMVGFLNTNNLFLFPFLWLKGIV